MVIRNWVECTLKTNPGDHIYGAAEQIDRRITMFLFVEYGTAVTWSSNDTPDLYAVSERMFKTLGEMMLSISTDEVLPKSLWWEVNATDCDITRMLPTKTLKGGYIYRGV